MLHPSLQRALIAYGAGAILAGVVTHAMNLGDACEDGTCGGHSR